MLAAIILGIIEGLTEFLPVSSTGHLIIATDFLKLNQVKYSSFNIIIQFGAILAVVFLYRERFIDFINIKKLKEIKTSKNLNLFHIFLAIFPVLSIGFISRKMIKQYLYNPLFVVFTTVFVAIIMILIEKKKPEEKIFSLDQISYKNAFFIGLGQVFALFPGVSRSGSTMLTSMCLKINTKTAADFSFLISVPVISAATLYELLKSWNEFDSNQIGILIVGLLTSFMVAIFAIKTFITVLKKYGLTPFAYYRIIFGILYYCLFIR